MRLRTPERAAEVIAGEQSSGTFTRYQGPQFGMGIRRAGEA